MAERAQILLKKEPIPERGFGQVLIQTLKRQWQFIKYYVPRLVLMCILFFIPILHPLLAFLWFLFNAWMLSMQYQDFVMDNNLVDFKTMRNMMKDRKSLSLGFGISISLFSFIPFVNFLIMPAAVVGGVFLFYDYPQKKF